MNTSPSIFRRWTFAIRGLAKTAVFFLKVFPMLPSRPVNWVTMTPVIDRVVYPTIDGQAEGEIYRPSSGGPYPGILVCLGVVPFGVEHPQVAVLGKALARAGFAVLLYWSPSMRDFRLDPVDIENISLAYHWLIHQSFVDSDRSGLLGTCVGGSFALMAAASSLIQDRIAFLAAYAPFSSMWTFVRDIASATRSAGLPSGMDGREPWQVDPLTRKVFVYSITAHLVPDEAERLRNAFAVEDGNFNSGGLSPDGQVVYQLLSAQGLEDALTSMRSLPAAVRERFEKLSPVNYLREIHSPLLVLLHDRGDQVIPVSESRHLVKTLQGHPGMHYTEMQFSHLDPVKGKLPLLRLLREFAKFIKAVYPIFRQSVHPGKSVTGMH